MARILLVSNAHHDNLTEYLTSWFEKVLEAVKTQSDVKVLELMGEEATKKNLTEIIEKENPQLVIFNGHGSDEVIAGFKQEILVRCDDNEVMLSGKIVHSMACKSANVLGQRCVTLGTKCFIGYKENFELWCGRQETKEAQLQDHVAGLFLAPAYETIIALIEGGNAGDAYKRSQNMYRQNILTLISSQNEKHRTEVAPSLFNNFRNQVCLGDQDAVF